jgi:membrane-associated phospholipid phosphatase
MAIYDSEDLLSFAFAIIALFPIFFAFGIAVSVWTHPRRSAFEFGLGILLNEITNKVLKKILSHDRPHRPYSHPLIEDEGKGNPSSHAQFVAFCLFWYLIRQQHTTLLFPRRKLLFSTVLGLMCVAVCVARVYNNQHSVSQVLLGSVVGVAMALLGRLYLPPLSGILFPRLRRLHSWLSSQ